MGVEELPRVLTDEQVARFHRDGFLLLENVLTPDEVARYRAAVLGSPPCRR